MKKLIIFLAAILFAFSHKEIREIYYKSYNYEKMGDYKDAIKVLIPLYEKYPNGYTINLRLGWLFYLDKKYKNAIKHYQKASLIAPYSVEPKLGLTRVYLAIENYNEALKVGNLILRNDYYNYYGNYYEAEALIGIKDYKNALSIINKMLLLYPTSVLFLNLLGKVYYLEGKKDLAKKVFENVLILDPNNVMAKKIVKNSKY